MKSVYPLLGGVLAFAVIARAQSVTDPHITSWLTTRSAQYARVYETTSDKTSGNAVSTWPRSGLTNGGGGQATAAYSDIQRVAYSTNYVYIYTTGLPSYTMGNWLTPTGSTYTSWPTNRAAIHRIPRNPSIPTTKQKSNGNGGVLVNGVFVWENGDAQSYTTSSGTVSMSGQGIWNRLAGVAEAFNFDPGYGHQPNSGAYHNHINPIALRYQLGDNVAYNSSTKTYSESGTPTRHSPILGWANDGLPIYGPYGYSSALDATSSIRRMVSGFQKRDGTNGTTNLASTGRTTLPKWAAEVQGKSQTLASTEYGPSTTQTYTVAPGVTGTYTLGIFAEDYEYLGDVGKTQGVDFDLNRQNVRYCVTPEYPSGTYAYFVCIDSSGNTVFPDIINQEFFGTAAAGQGTVTSISESVTEYQDVGPAAAIAVAASASGSGVALSWNSAEGATYKVESSSDNSTWTTVSSAVTSGGLTTNYTATASATYFKVTLTAIATYDTGGTYGTAVGKTGTVQYGTVIPAPNITTQPSNLTVTAGSSATFTIVASGTAPLTYQWKKAGSAISGATNASYTIASTTTADAGSYTCVVTNSGGSTTSNAATLTVNSGTVAPSISTQPSNVTVTAGARATLSVVATGTAPLTYQWKKSSQAISGATDSSYTIAVTQTTDSGSYTCTVTNSAGSATSNAATLTVNAAVVAPSITAQPSSTSVSVGSSASFSVTASGTAPLSYRWYKGVIAISGAVSSTFTIASAQTTDAGSYTCVVTNSAGSATSNAATLTVNTPVVVPTITTHPASTSASVGGNVTFSVAASGTAPLSYQWKKGGTAISGATNATFAITNVQTSDAGTFTCTVSNSGGSATSNGATLTVSALSVAPTIASSPASATVTAGNSASFSVVANGTAPLAYQWLKNGSAISGASSATYTIASAQTSDAANYSCTVTNSVGSATSAAATLTVSTAVVAPTITQQPSDVTVTEGSAASFAITATGTVPLSYQWYKGVDAIVGATSATYTIAATALTDAGSFTCVVTNSAGQATSTASTLVVNAKTSTGGNGGSSGGSGSNPARIINLGVRTQIGGAAGTPAVGFVLRGSGASKRVILRAVGPTLVDYGVTNALLDPQLQLWTNGAMIASNDNWQLADLTSFTSVGAFPLTIGSADAGIVMNLAGGNYSTPIVAPNGTSGVVLIECYDGASNDTSMQFVNASALALVGTGDNVLIPGFVITGEGTVRLLVRAVGPQLRDYGVGNLLADPQFKLYHDGAVIAENDNWSDSANAQEIETTATQVGAFGLLPGSKDAAFLVTLPAGLYSAVCSGVGGTTGQALVEVYVVP